MYASNYAFTISLESTSKIEKEVASIYIIIIQICRNPVSHIEDIYYIQSLCKF